MTGPAQSDFYAVLELTQAATGKEVKDAFKRLALLHHPDKNLGNPNSCAAFRKVREAFEVLGDVQRRKIYDLTYTQSNPQRNAHQRAHQGPSGPKRETYPSEETKDKEKRARELQKRHLIVTEGSRLAEKRKIEETLEKAEKRVNESIKTEKEIWDNMNRTQGWWDYLTWKSKKEPSADEKLQQERERLQAIALRRIREKDLSQVKEKLRVVEEALADLAKRRRAIEEQEASEERERVRKAKEKADAEAAARWREWMAELAKEAERRQEQERREREQAAREWKKREEDAARERKIYMEAREKAEKERRAREQQMADRQRQSNAYRASMNASTGTDRDHCRHTGWWPKAMGAATCEICGSFFRQWVLTCPTCSMLACAACQRTVRGRSAWPATPPPERNHPQRERRRGHREGLYCDPNDMDDYYDYY